MISLLFLEKKVAKNVSTYSLSRSLPLVRKLPQAILLIRCSLAMCGFLAFIRCCETRICKHILKHSRTFSYKCSATHCALECAALFKITMHRKGHRKTNLKRCFGFAIRSNRSWGICNPLNFLGLQTLTLILQRITYPLHRKGLQWAKIIDRLIDAHRKISKMIDFFLETVWGMFNR